jgi:hypothetical protein
MVAPLLHSIKEGCKAAISRGRNITPFLENDLNQVFAIFLPGWE